MNCRASTSVLPITTVCGDSTGSLLSIANMNRRAKCGVLPKLEVRGDSMFQLSPRGSVNRRAIIALLPSADLRGGSLFLGGCMTLNELLARLHTGSVSQVFRDIAADPAIAQDFALTLGPHLVAPLLRDERRKNAIVAPASGGRVPSPRSDWSRMDWRRYADWLKSFYRGVKDGWQFAERVTKAFGKEDNLAYGKLRARLDELDAARLDKICGKRLAA